MMPSQLIKDSSLLEVFVYIVVYVVFCGFDDTWNPLRKRMFHSHHQFPFRAKCSKWRSYETRIKAPERESEVNQRIMDMEAKLHKTQELELEIEKLKGSTNVMNHMAGSDAEFLAAVRKKHRGAKGKAEIKAMELCSTWEIHIGDVQRHPFKVDVSAGTEKRVVNKKDKKFFKLKNKYGEVVRKEVIRARLEMYNPSGGYVVLDLWNYEQNRKATMEEATGVLLKGKKNSGT